MPSLVNNIRVEVGISIGGFAPPPPLSAQLELKILVPRRIGLSFTPNNEIIADCCQQDIQRRIRCFLTDGNRTLHLFRSQLYT